MLETNEVVQEGALREFHELTRIGKGYGTRDWQVGKPALQGMGNRVRRMIVSGMGNPKGETILACDLLNLLPYSHMQPIDRPFRPAWDFFVVWVFLAAIMFFVTRRSELAELPLAYGAELILVPLFATFLLYGPVLLTRQILRSGSRGWFVASVLVTVLLAAGLFAAVMFYTGQGGHASLWSGGAAFAAISYLHWRLADERQA